MPETFKEILSLDFRHDYYQSGHTSDVSVSPSPTTVRKLAGYQMLFNKKLSGFTLSHSVSTDGNPQIALEAHDPFRFEMTLINPNFSNFTQGQEINDYVSIYYQSDGDVLSFKNLRLLPKLFNYPIDAGDGRIKQVGLRILTGNTLIEERDVRLISGRSTEQIDLRRFPFSDITIQVTKKGKVIKHEDLISDDRLFQKKPLGLIDLKLGHLSGKHSSYAIEFKTKKIIWKYFVILRKEEAEFAYKIEDRGNNDELNRYTALDLSFVEKTLDEPLNGARALVFESGTLTEEKQFEPLEIPFYEENKRNLCIVKYPMEKDSHSPKKKYKKYYRKYDDDDDDDDDKKYTKEQWFYYHMVKRSWWNKKLRRHYVTHWKDLYEKVRLRKPGKVVVPNLPKPSVSSAIPEVYIYL